MNASSSNEVRKKPLSRAATFSDKSFSWRHRIRKYRGLKVHFRNKKKKLFETENMKTDHAGFSDSRLPWMSKHELSGFSAHSSEKAFGKSSHAQANWPGYSTLLISYRILSIPAND